MSWYCIGDLFFMNFQLGNRAPAVRRILSILALSAPLPSQECWSGHIKLLPDYRTVVSEKTSISRFRLGIVIWLPPHFALVTVSLLLFVIHSHLSGVTTAICLTCIEMRMISVSYIFLFRARMMFKGWNFGLRAGIFDTIKNERLS